MEARQAFKKEPLLRVGIITEIDGLDKAGIFVDLSKKASNQRVNQNILISSEFLLKEEPGIT